jgi:purine-binding chemotaxis protein CheW
MTTKTLEKPILQEKQFSQNVNDGDLTRQFLVFRIGDAEYCVNLNSVREITSVTNLTHIPNAPDYMQGFINFRGLAIPVFDLKKKFGIGAIEPGKKNILILLNCHDMLIGVLAQEASEILTVQNHQINPMPEFEYINFVSGLIQKEKIMVIILEINKIFDLQSLQNIRQFSHSQQHLRS